MTFLYIKKHNKTGLQYFGKTNEVDPISYPGSGTYWKNHLKEHGNDVTTVWYEKFEDVVLLTNYAINFSIENNIVDAKDNTGKKIWANLVMENGVDGFPAGGKMPPRSALHLATWSNNRKGHFVSNETRKKQSDKKIGTTASTETKAKHSANTSGGKNPNALVWEITSPTGNIITATGLRAYCRENDISFRDVYYSKNGWKSVKFGTGKGGGRKKKEQND